MVGKDKGRGGGGKLTGGGNTAREELVCPRSRDRTSVLGGMSLVEGRRKSKGHGRLLTRDAKNATPLCPRRELREALRFSGGKL